MSTESDRRRPWNVTIIAARVASKLEPAGPVDIPSRTQRHSLSQADVTRTEIRSRTRWTRDGHQCRRGHLVPFPTRRRRPRQKIKELVSGLNSSNFVRYITHDRKVLDLKEYFYRGTKIHLRTQLRSLEQYFCAHWDRSKIKELVSRLNSSNFVRYITRRYVRPKVLDTREQ